MALRAKNGRLFLDFYCYLPDGRKIRCREYTTLPDTKKNRKVLEAKDKAIQYELKHGHFDYLHFFPNGSRAHFFRRPAFSDIVFSDWWNQWLEEKTLRYNTAKGWDSSYRVHIGPHFGHVPISDMTDHEILVFRKSLEQKGLNANSINDKIMKPLCMALLSAFIRGVIDKYPCNGLRRLTEVRPKIDPFSFEELAALLEFLEKKKPEYHDMFFIWSRTGLRPGELYALKWREHVDFFNQKLLIRKTRHQNGSEGPPKTRHSIRDVDLRPKVIEALKRQEARTGLMDSYVFMTHANKPFSDAFMRKKFSHLLKLAKIKHRPPRQMRHTFATLHIAAGENITWVSHMLGHASVEITMKRYNRFIPNLTRDDGSAFERIMQERKKEKAKAALDPQSQNGPS